MVDTRTLNGVQLKLMKILSRFNLNLVCLDTYFFITCGLKILMNYSFETRVKVSHSHSVLLWSAMDGTEAGQNLKYTIRSIVCKAFCHPVIWVILFFGSLFKSLFGSLFWSFGPFRHHFQHCYITN